MWQKILSKHSKTKIMKKLLLVALTVAVICVCCSGSALASSGPNFSTTARAACVMEQSSGRMLYQKNAQMPLPMASTTKIVTALTVLNNCENIDEVCVIPKAAVGIEGSSIYLREGEKLTVRELLCGLMLRSGNDCAVALALKIGGSLENFAEMMNATATECGATNSNFVTPHGLHDENHYTTAEDLAKITCVALKNQTFRQIVASKSTKISNDGYDYDRVLVNKNKLLSGFEGADGVKTGYTTRAGRCFVGSATRNGMQVVVVVLNCGPMFEETAQMLEVAFANYSLKVAVPKNKLCGVVYDHGHPTYYSCESGFSYPLAETEKLSTKITLEDNCKEIEVLVDGKRVWSCPLTENG